MLFRNLLIVAAAVFLTASACYALEGVVVNEEGDPLEAVTVTTDLKSVGAVTNEQGAFELPDDAGISRVTFSRVGYQSRQIRPGNMPQRIELEPLFLRGEDIVVRGDRVESSRAAAVDNYTQEEIERDYTAGELPLLLSTSPNVYVFADAGSALGYSYMRIRGFDDKRVATYINGVPLNDPEWQSTYFVDIPDIASNVTDIQIQRGVGHALYGDAAFGGSVNIATNAFAQPQRTRISAGYGEYTSNGSTIGGIYKQSLEYSSGMIDGRWLFSGRFSKVRTDGYRYDSWYDGWSYYFSLARLDPNMTTELYVYGGPMKMHLAYTGATREQINEDRRANPFHTYDNETDNFNQPHYHLHNTYRLSERATLDNTIYYIRGKGYWEQKIGSATFADYAIDTSLTGGEPSGDLVRQLWVYKHQVGWNPRLDIEHDRGRHTIGGSVYYFKSDHWGNVVWARPLVGMLDPQHKYNQYYGRKQVASLYGQEKYDLSERWSLRATAQLRYQRYDMEQTGMGAFETYDYAYDWLFFSPRLGITYQPRENLSLHALIGVSSRTPAEPNVYDAENPNAIPSLEIEDTRVSGGDTSYVFGDPTAKSERVYDFELGAEYRRTDYRFGANAFWMEFRDEIIPAGQVNPNTGYPMMVNADRSVHAGLELTGAAKPHKYFTVEANYSYNYNRVKDYVGKVDVYPGSGAPYQIDYDYSDKVIPAFPEHLANLIIGFDHRRFGAALKLQYAGKQYLELANVDSLAIDAYTVASLSAEYRLPQLLGTADFALQVRVDNLFDTEYETSGYGWSYGLSEDANSDVSLVHEGHYYVAAERSYFVQLKLDLY